MSSDSDSDSGSVIAEEGDIEIPQRRKSPSILDLLEKTLNENGDDSSTMVTLSRKSIPTAYKLSPKLKRVIKKLQEPESDLNDENLNKNLNEIFDRYYNEPDDDEIQTNIKRLENVYENFPERTSQSEENLFVEEELNNIRKEQINNRNKIEKIIYNILKDKHKEVKKNSDIYNNNKFTKTVLDILKDKCEDVYSLLFKKPKDMNIEELDKLNWIQRWKKDKKITLKPPFKELNLDNKTMKFKEKLQELSGGLIEAQDIYKPKSKKTDDIFIGKVEVITKKYIIEKVIQINKIYLFILYWYYKMYRSENKLFDFLNIPGERLNEIFNNKDIQTLSSALIHYEHNEKNKTFVKIFKVMILNKIIDTVQLIYDLTDKDIKEIAKVLNLKNIETLKYTIENLLDSKIPDNNLYENPLSVGVNLTKIGNKNDIIKNIYNSKYSKAVDFIEPLMYNLAGIEYWVPKSSKEKQKPQTNNPSKSNDRLDIYLKLSYAYKEKENYDKSELINDKPPLERIPYLRKFLDFNDFLAEWRKTFSRLKNYHTGELEEFYEKKIEDIDNYFEEQYNELDKKKSLNENEEISKDKLIYYLDLPSSYD